MKIDWTKFKNIPKTVGTTRNSGNTIGNTYSKAFPYTKKDWEQVGTLKSSNIEAVPTSVQVGTEWEHYEVLKSDAVLTVPGVPIEKEMIIKKNKYENKEENSWLWIPDEKELLKRMNSGKKVVLTCDSESTASSISSRLSFMLLTIEARKQKGILPVYWHIEALRKYIEIKPDSYFSIYKAIIPEPEVLIKYIRIVAEEHL